jgi:hypothetical protein
MKEGNTSSLRSAFDGFKSFADIPSAMEWSGREDLNLRLPRPERGALPGCATPRSLKIFM